MNTFSHEEYSGLDPHDYHDHSIHYMQNEPPTGTQAAGTQAAASEPTLEPLSLLPYLENFHDHEHILLDGLTDLHENQVQVSTFEPLSLSAECFRFGAEPSTFMDNPYSGDQDASLLSSSAKNFRNLSEGDCSSSEYFATESDMMMVDADYGTGYGYSFLDFRGVDEQLPSSAASSTTSFDTSSFHSSASSSSSSRSEDDFGRHPHSDDYSTSDASSTVFMNSPSMRASSSFSGLIADLNMFERTPAFDGLCIAPSALMGPLKKTEEESDSADDSHSERWVLPTLPSVSLEPEEPAKQEEARLTSENVDRIDELAKPLVWTNFASGDFSRVIDLAYHHVHAHLPFFVPGAKLEFKPETEFLNCEDYLYEFDSRPNLQPDVTHSLEVSERVPLSDRTISIYTNKPGCADHPKKRGKANTVPLFINEDQIVDVALINNHKGVSIDDVFMKTAYFRSTNPGRKLSDDHLFNFAGRMSQTGEHISGYRCYIVGCHKATKRKDHMADHIRTHLGEKPFHCSICGLGFIRNNDCQRHENNHRPDKRFVCECKAAFSRRDLYVRHQKTACVLLFRSMPPTAPRRRRRAGAGRKTSPFKLDRAAFDDLDFRPGFAN